MTAPAPKLNDIRAVFFDAGNTLLQADPPVAIRYAETANRYGAGADPDSIQDRFVTLWTVFQKQRQAMLFKTTRHGTKRFWNLFVAEVFAPWREQFSDFDAFFEELYLAFASHTAWVTYEDALPTLQALQQRNIRLAVVSNWDDRLTGILNGQKLTHFFEEIIISSEEGVEKPALELFSVALDRMGIEPRQVIHVGDSLSDDVYGALAAGIHPALIHRNDAPLSATVPRQNGPKVEGDPEAPWYSLTDLRQLMDLIG